MSLLWSFSIPSPDYMQQGEDPFTIQVRAKKPSCAPPGVVDLQCWTSGLEPYLRLTFEIDSKAVKSIGLQSAS